MRRFLIALGVAIAAYIVGVFISMQLVMLLSSNTHDRSVEAAMTSAFVYGPVIALIAFCVAIVKAKPKPKPQVTTP